jgi:hypothetical protein
VTKAQPGGGQRRRHHGNYQAIFLVVSEKFNVPACISFLNIDLEKRDPGATQEPRKPLMVGIGLSWQSASFCDIFSRAPVRDIAPDANQAATLAKASLSSMRRKTLRSIMELFLGIHLPALPLLNARFYC